MGYGVIGDGQANRVMGRCLIADLKMTFWLLVLFQKS